MDGSGALYAETRARITELVQGLDHDRASTLVPTCPEWSVRDVVAHLTGVCADILEGRLDGVTTDAWTARHVVERRHRTLTEIVQEWTENAPKVEAIAHAFPDGADVQWLADCVTHEHDIRLALSQPGARDSEAVATAMRWLARSLGSSEGLAFGGGGSDADSPTFRILTPEGDDITVGLSQPWATLRISRFEALRALTGRRSESQIASYDWDGDHRPHLEAFERGPFSLAAQPIHE